jgi:diguanylate cyclase (GGDEF)-like protein
MNQQDTESKREQNQKMLSKRYSITGSRTKTLWLFSLVLFIMFFLMSWSSYHVAQNSISHQIEENSLPLTSDNIYSQIQRDLVEPTFVAALMAHNTFLRDWALQSNPEEAPIHRYLQEIDKRFDTTISFFVHHKSHLMYLPYQKNKVIDVHSPKNDWYEKVKALSDNKPYLVSVGPDPEDSGKKVIFIARKVYDYQNNFLGVVGVGLAMKKVIEFVGRYELRYQRTIYFVDREGNIVLKGDNYQGQQKIQNTVGIRDIATKILSEPSGHFSYKDNQERVFVNARLIPEFGWYLIVEEHESPSQKAVFKTFLINVSIAGLITILVLVISYLTQGRYQQRLSDQATQDPLTQVLNRRGGEDAHATMMEKAQSQSADVSVIVFDIDHFKQINDQYGHEIGDAVLQKVVSHLQHHIRQTDAVCRWGGEEFIVILNNCKSHQAYKLAEQIRTSVAMVTFDDDCGTIQLTMSGGVAQTLPGEVLENVVKRADKALYQAKRDGRNQVAMAE